MLKFKKKSVAKRLKRTLNLINRKIFEWIFTGMTSGFLAERCQGDRKTRKHVGGGKRRLNVRFFGVFLHVVLMFHDSLRRITIRLFEEMIEKAYVVKFHTRWTTGLDTSSDLVFTFYKQQLPVRSLSSHFNRHD